LALYELYWFLSLLSQLSFFPFIDRDIDTNLCYSFSFTIVTMSYIVRYMLNKWIMQLWKYMMKSMQFQPIFMRQYMFYLSKPHKLSLLVLKFHPYLLFNCKLVFMFHPYIYFSIVKRSPLKSKFRKDRIECSKPSSCSTLSHHKWLPKLISMLEK
jgi:hypothetical protein